MKNISDDPKVLSESSKKAVKENSWNISQDKCGILGRAVTVLPEGAQPTSTRTVKSSVRVP
jgi:hypothetical protein